MNRRGILNVRTLLLIVAVFVITLGSVMVYSYRTQNSSSVGKIELSYNGVSEGLNPDGTRFSIYELQSNDFLQKVIEHLGVSELSVDNLRSSIRIDSVEGVRDPEAPESAAAAYQITVNRKYLRTIDPERVLRAILDVYNQEFSKKYCTVDVSSCRIDWNRIDLEYWDLLDLLKTKTGMIRQYLAQVKAGTDWSTSEEFTVLDNAVADFQSSQLSSLETYLKQHAVFKDIEAYQNVLRIRKLNVTNENRRNEAKYELLESVLASRGNSLGSSLYSGGSAYSGLDALSNKMLETAQQCRESRSKLDTLNLQLKNTTGLDLESLIEENASEWLTSSLRLNTVTSRDLLQVKEQIASVQSQYDALLSRFSDTLEQYITSGYSQAIHYGIYEHSLIQMLNIRKAILFAVLISLVVGVFGIALNKSRRK